MASERILTFTYNTIIYSAPHIWLNDIPVELFVMSELVKFLQWTQTLTQYRYLPLARLRHKWASSSRPDPWPVRPRCIFELLLKPILLLMMWIQINHQPASGSLDKPRRSLGQWGQQQVQSALQRPPLGTQDLSAAPKRSHLQRNSPRFFPSLLPQPLVPP